MIKRLAVFFALPAAIGMVIGVVTQSPGAYAQDQVTSLEQLVRPTPTTSPSPEPVPTLTPSPTPSESPSEEPSPEPSETEEPPEPRVLSAEELQERLTELGYYYGPIDGDVTTEQSQTAVMALQKVAGVTVNGATGDEVWEAIADPPEPQLLGGDDMRIEVDLDLQVVHWVVNGEVERTMHASSGGGHTYTSSAGNPATAVTPVGDYVIERRIDGVRNAPLGTLYDPLYFYEGWAIHGSNSVPAHPASSGCVRLTREDARWLFDRAPDGVQVLVHGGEFVFTPAGQEAPTAAADDVEEADPGTDTPGA